MIAAVSWLHAPHRFGGLGALVGVLPDVDVDVPGVSVHFGPLPNDERRAEFAAFVDGVIANWANLVRLPLPDGHTGFGKVGNVPDEGTLTVL